MTALRFTSVMKLRDINPYVLVSAARARRIKPDWRKPMPVLVRIDGKPALAWRINMMPVGDGSFYLYLHGDVRRASGTKVGDRVRVEVSFDADYKSGPLPLPPWFKQALRKSPRAVEHWEKLIPSRKKEVLRYLINLKSPAARARNLEKTLHVLSGNEARFMGRSWKQGA